MIVGTLTKAAGMEGDGDEEVGSPVGKSTLPGSIEETGKGAIESKAAVELETMDGVTQRLFIKTGGDSPGKSRRMEEAFPADMIAPADRGKGESTARTTRGSEGEKTAQTAKTKGGIR